MKTCENCGRPYSHAPDWPGSCTDDGICQQCREDQTLYGRMLEQEEAEMEGENPPPVKCDYCGAPGGGINPVDPLCGWLAWIIWLATNKLSYGRLGCYLLARRDSETAVAEMSDVRTAWQDDR